MCFALITPLSKTLFSRKDDGFSRARKQRRERERERERERKREIVSELELYSLCWRFGFFSLVVQEHECLLALLRVVFSRWSRRKKERECAEEEENDFKNKRDDTEHRL